MECGDQIPYNIRAGIQDNYNTWQENGYNKYQETKNLDFTTNYLQVVGNIIVGGGCGFAVGLLWFISVPMLISRKYEGIQLDIVRIYKK